MYLGDLIKVKETTFKCNLNIVIIRFYDMSQIRNVTLIVIATAIMAIVTSILVYFVDYITVNVRESTARFVLELQQKYIQSYRPHI